MDGDKGAASFEVLSGAVNRYKIISSIFSSATGKWDGVESVYGLEIFCASHCPAFISYASYPKPLSVVS